MLACPKCKSADLHRSRTKSGWEAWRKEILGKRPYRCRACGWRGWGIDSGPKFGDIEKELAERALAPEPPNLKGTVLSREEARRKDVSLADLDTLTPIGAALLEESPVPDREWPRVLAVFDRDRLAALLGISPSSAVRYARGERRTPDAVAARLHFIALVSGDLAGAYNPIGIRRWFERPRAALDGRAPADRLAGDWAPDDEGAVRIRELARSVVESPAT